MTETNIAERTQLPAELLTLKPDAYVAAVYQSFGERLAAAKLSASATDYDVKTTAGMKVAIDRRATLRAIRVEVEKARKERKAPILEIGKLLDTRAKELTAEIEPLEDAHDALIKAEEARKEAEKQARIEAEKQRVAAIHERIADLRAQAAACAGHSSADIAENLALVEAAEITVDIYAELAGQAQLAKDETIAKLRELHAATVAREEQAAREKAEREAEAARLKAERDELERMKAEQAERDRIAAEERERAAAEAKAARDAEEARQRAEREAHEADMRRQREEQEAQLQAQRAELARQQAELDRLRREQEEAAERARREREAAERAEQERIAAEQRKAQEEAAAKQAEAERQAREKARAEYRAKLWAAHERVLVPPFNTEQLIALLLKAGIDDSFSDPLVPALDELNLRIGPSADAMKQAA